MLQEKGPLTDLSKHVHAGNPKCPFQALQNPSHTSGTKDALWGIYIPQTHHKTSPVQRPNIGCPVSITAKVEHT